MTRIIIAGGRGFNDGVLVDHVMSTLLGGCFQVEIVSGGARGADYIGEEWARQNKQKLTIMKANWDEYGRSAGIKRNLDMANYSDALVAFWNGKSRGTKHMIDIALEKGLDVHVYRYEGDE